MNCNNTDMPLISIIMGAYNAEKTISQCIDSIISQTYINWEFIICNDHSSDGTLEILQSYANRDGRIRILNNAKNLRLAASLNYCLKNAKGKYIARMDADDISMPNRLEKQVAYLEKHPEIDCIGCNMYVFEGETDKGIRTHYEAPDKKILLRRTPFFHPTIMMKKSVYDSLKGYTVSNETMRAEDLDLWFRFYASGFKGRNMQEALYRYHESEDDFNKRTLKAAIQTSKVYLRGYKLLGFPIYYYVFALKPIVSSLVPNKMIQRYHQSKLMHNAG